MPVSATTLQKLMAAGVSGDALLDIIASIDADHGYLQSRPKSGAAVRQARYRERKKEAGVMGGDVTRDVTRDVTENVTRPITNVTTVTPIARVEDTNSNSEPEHQGKEERKKDAKPNDIAEFRSELSDLDTERLDALIKHRRSKRGQITGHAARLFRRDAESAGLSMADATDTCISRNWITVKAEWLNDDRRSNGARAGPPLRGLAAAEERFRQDLANGKYSDSEEEGGDIRSPAGLPLLEHQRR